MQTITRTIKETLVEGLRSEIIQGHLQPGQRRRQEELAVQFDVSTIPIREALRDLEAEGLVTIVPHRGAVVTQLSAADLQDIYDIRIPLEEMATRMAVPRLPQTVLADLNTCLQEMDKTSVGDVATLVKLNHHFHSTLYAASNRHHLCELLTMLRHRTQHYLRAYVNECGGMPQAQEEHWAIFKACQRGNAGEAAAIMREHIFQVSRTLIQYVQQQEEGN